jgi:hypothetical protein
MFRKSLSPLGLGDIWPTHWPPVRMIVLRALLDGSVQRLIGTAYEWKMTIEAHTKMPIEMTNGINDHPSSRGTDQRIGAPTFSPVS